MPETVRVTVMVAASVMATTALPILALGAKLTLGVTAVLNSNPVGALMTNVTPVPAAKSFVTPSAIVIAPSVVHAGDDALAAVSAKRVALAGAIITAAKAPLTPAHANAKANNSAIVVFFLRFIKRVLLILQ